REHDLIRSEGGRAAGNRAGHGRVWAAFEWLLPVRVVRHVRYTARLVRSWAEGAAAHARADITLARREIGALLPRVGTGSLVCAAAATLGPPGARSLVTGVTLV